MYDTPSQLFLLLQSKNFFMYDFYMSKTIDLIMEATLKMADVMEHNNDLCKCPCGTKKWLTKNIEDLRSFALLNGEDADTPEEFLN